MQNMNLSTKVCMYIPFHLYCYTEQIEAYTVKQYVNIIIYTVKAYFKNCLKRSHFDKTTGL